MQIADHCPQQHNRNISIAIGIQLTSLSAICFHYTLSIYLKEYNGQSGRITLMTYWGRSLPLQIGTEGNPHTLPIQTICYLADLAEGNTHALPTQSKLSLKIDTEGNPHALSAQSKICSNVELHNFTYIVDYFKTNLDSHIIYI